MTSPSLISSTVPAAIVPPKVPVCHGPNASAPPTVPVCQGPNWKSRVLMPPSPSAPIRPSRVQRKNSRRLATAPGAPRVSTAPGRGPPRPALANHRRLLRVVLHPGRPLAAVDGDIAPVEGDGHEIEGRGRRAGHVLAVAQIDRAVARAMEEPLVALERFVGLPGHRAAQVLAFPEEGDQYALVAERRLFIAREPELPRLVADDAAVFDVVDREGLDFAAEGADLLGHKK